MSDKPTTHVRQDEIDARLAQVAANGGGVVDISDLTIDDHLPAITAEIEAIQRRERTVVPPERIMANNAILLRALADTLTLDLAVAPVVLASEPGIGTSTMTRGIAETLGMRFLDVRCAALDVHDFGPLHIIRDGSIVEAQPRLAWLVDQFEDGRPTLVLLDEALSSGHEAAVRVLKQIAEHAKGPIVVALRTTLPEEEEALDAIAQGLGIHRSHVPTARLSMSEDVVQPILAVGHLEHDGSKCGERYFELQMEEPFDSSLRFTVFASPGQDDDDLNEALDPVWAHRTPVAVRLEVVDGSLRCAPTDIEALA